jgi:hypothetical protein
MNANMPKKTGIKRKQLIIIASVLLALAGVWGLWRQVTHHPPAWMVRWQVSSYLKKHSVLADFAIAFPFPSKAELAKVPATPKAADAAAPKGKRTNKDFDTLAREYLDLKTSALAQEREIAESEQAIEIWKPRLERMARDLARSTNGNATNRSSRPSQVASLQKRLEGFEKTKASTPALQSKLEALEPMVSDLWDFQRAWAAEEQTLDVADPNALAKARAQLTAETRQKISEAKSYETIYKHIGQHLWVAERLLDGANPQYQRMGVSLALEASHLAMDEAQNGWLAARIVEGYVWPHLAVADQASRRSAVNLDNLLNECGNIFRGNDEFGNVIRNYKILLARAGTPQRADQARLQIARACEQSGDLKAALAWLRQIKATNEFAAALRWIPRLEQQLKRAR